MNFSPFTLYKIKVVILTIIGCIIPSYIIYIRLIMDRFPREIFTDISVIQLFIYMDLFLIFLFLSISTGYYLYREKYPPRRKINIKILKILIEKYKDNMYILSEIYRLSLLYFHKFLKNTVIEKWLGQEFFFMDILPPFKKLFATTLPDYFNYIIIIFTIIPQIIMLITLGIDIFIFEEFRYFYILSPIYLIPLAFKYYIFTIKSAAIDLLQGVAVTIKITKISTGEEITPLQFIVGKGLYKIPYKGVYYIYPGKEEECYKYFDDHEGKLTDIFLKYRAYMSPEEQQTYFKEEVLLMHHHYGDSLIIAMKVTSVIKEYAENFNLIILSGYAISWGYVFIRSAYMYIN